MGDMTNERTLDSTDPSWASGGFTARRGFVYLVNPSPCVECGLTVDDHENESHQYHFAPGEEPVEIDLRS